MTVLRSGKCSESMTFSLFGYHLAQQVDLFMDKLLHTMSEKLCHIVKIYVYFCAICIDLIYQPELGRDCPDSRELIRYAYD